MDSGIERARNRRALKSRAQPDIAPYAIASYMDDAAGAIRVGLSDSFGLFDCDGYAVLAGGGPNRQNHRQDAGDKKAAGNLGVDLHEPLETGRGARVKQIGRIT